MRGADVLVPIDDSPFLADLMLKILNGLKAGRTCTRFVHERTQLEFEVTVTRISGKRVPKTRGTPCPG